MVLVMLVLVMLSPLLGYSSEASPPKPATPNFDIQFIDRSYNVPTTTSTDPYTGKPLTQESYYVQNYTIEITIQNQPYTPTKVENSSSLMNEIYYNIRFKGHYGDEWRELLFDNCPKQSNSTYTVVTYGPACDRFIGLAPDMVIDFQVQALFGYFSRMSTFLAPWYFDGQKSDWSGTQTIALPEADASVATPSSSVSSSQKPILTPVPSHVGSTVFFGLTVIEIVVSILLGMIAVSLIVLILYIRKKAYEATKTDKESQLTNCGTCMRKKSMRIFSFVFVFTLLCLIVMDASSAATIPKPVVPEFTVNLINSSYNTHPTPSTNPYTGQTTTPPSQHIEARTIEIKIKHPSFTPFEIEDNSVTYTVGLMYNVRWKGHFENEWHTIYDPAIHCARGEVKGDYYIVSYQGIYSPTEGLVMSDFSTTFPSDAQVDFQVEALIGYFHYVSAYPFSSDVFEGQESGWSGTQALTIFGDDISTVVPSSSVLSAPDPTFVALQPAGDSAVGLGWREIALVLLVFTVVLLVGCVVFLSKRRMIRVS